MRNFATALIITLAVVSVGFVMLSPSTEVSASVLGVHAAPRTTVGSYDIEVVRVEAIDNGVQVYARVWDADGGQIGFGADGTVDIERFVIIDQRDDGDRQQAALETIASDIPMLKNAHHDSAGIIPGKEGHTTYTFFVSTAAGDGNTERLVPGCGSETCGEAWGTIRTGAGTSVNNTNNGLLIRTFPANVSNNWYILDRAFFPFDTSSIPDTDVISSATLSLYVTGKSDTDAQLTAGLAVYSSTQASVSTIATSDHALTGTTAYSSAITYANITTSAYNSFAFNATGIAAISQTGDTKLSVKMVADSGNSPEAWQYNSGHNNAIYIAATETAGSSQDPKLVVEAAPPVTFTPLFWSSAF